MMITSKNARKVTEEGKFSYPTPRKLVEVGIRAFL